MLLIISLLSFSNQLFLSTSHFFNSSTQRINKSTFLSIVIKLLHFLEFLPWSEFTMRCQKVSILKTENDFRKSGKEKIKNIKIIITKLPFPVLPFPFPDLRFTIYNLRFPVAKSCSITSYIDLICPSCSLRVLITKTS